MLQEGLAQGKSAGISGSRRIYHYLGTLFIHERFFLVSKFHHRDILEFDDAWRIGPARAGVGDALENLRLGTGTMSWPASQCGSVPF
jgi:hypothetical protein